MNPNVIIIHQKDNVAITLGDIALGETLHIPDRDGFAARSDIPYSHKVALQDIEPGADIIKYGEIIGQAKELINKGKWIHTHNLIINE
jgi:altronate dehydratase